jgi:hypothetical protein
LAEEGVYYLGYYGFVPSSTKFLTKEYILYGEIVKRDDSFIDAERSKRWL